MSVLCFYLHNIFVISSSYRHSISCPKIKLLSIHMSLVACFVRTISPLTFTTHLFSFSFLCVPNLHPTKLNIHFTIYYVSWRVWFLDLQTVTYIFYLTFILPFSFSFFSLIAMIPLISPLCISLLSSCFQMLLLSSLSSWCYSCSYHLLLYSSYLSISYPVCSPFL